MRASSPGTTDSGVGRSEMSSPGKGVLVHVGPHVAGVDRPHPDARVLGGQHCAHLVERRLRRAVAAPTLVVLDGRVRGHVEHVRGSGDASRAGNATCTRARGASRFTS